MITVDEALALVLRLAPEMQVEDVALRHAAGRVLAQALSAQQTQPPFPASAMDGYAVADTQVAKGDHFTVVGEAAAGHPFEGTVPPGGAIRIFTGAPLPDGLQRVIIQEDVDRAGDVITIRANVDDALHIRPAGGDFAAGQVFDAPRRLGARDIALLAAMGHATLPVARAPEIAILMTGDELRLPGQPLSPGQITASNGFGLAAMFEAAGARTRLLPVARDTVESLETCLDLAAGADLLVTIGGASVGDHDLVATVLKDRGTDMQFHGIRMRPGKPLMAGKLGDMAIIGLPGNPVSSMVCGVLFILPWIQAVLGLPAEHTEQMRPLAADLPANGPRQHYMRAVTLADGSVRVADRQDSSLLSVLADADCLVIRPPHDVALQAGDEVRVMDLPG